MNKMAEYLMGIDNGGTVSKAAIFTLDGKEVSVAARGDKRGYKEIWNFG
jgi:sugar (pentulose or hexulose) kinase